MAERSDVKMIKSIQYSKVQRETRKASSERLDIKIGRMIRHWIFQKAQIDKEQNVKSLKQKLAASEATVQELLSQLEAKERTQVILKSEIRRHAETFRTCQRVIDRKRSSKRVGSHSDNAAPWSCFGIWSRPFRRRFSSADARSDVKNSATLPVLCERGKPNGVVGRFILDPLIHLFSSKLLGLLPSLLPAQTQSFWVTSLKIAHAVVTMFSKLGL